MFSADVFGNGYGDEARFGDVVRLRFLTNDAAERRNEVAAAKALIVSPIQKFAHIGFLRRGLDDEQIAG
jgi:hypothetical protein